MFSLTPAAMAAPFVIDGAGAFGKRGTPARVDRPAGATPVFDRILRAPARIGDGFR
jgi:hypothetical protein